MADLSITATAVVAGSNARITDGVAGETIAAGKMVYRALTSRAISLADNNSATAEVRLPLGIALNGGAAGQRIAVATEGDVTVGATLTPGVFYYLSDTPGGICPVADLLAGEYPCIVGQAINASVLRMRIVSAGVAL